MDVTIPFEGEVGSLEARRTKEHKYASLKSWLETQYTEVSVDAFIIGALGSWDPCNEPVLKKLGETTLNYLGNYVPPLPWKVPISCGLLFLLVIPDESMEKGRKK